jgi:hypothetical protein
LLDAARGTGPVAVPLRHLIVAPAAAARSLDVGVKAAAFRRMFTLRQSPHAATAAQFAHRLERLHAP